MVSTGKFARSFDEGVCAGGAILFASIFQTRWKRNMLHWAILWWWFSWSVADKVSDLVWLDTGIAAAWRCSCADSTRRERRTAPEAYRSATKYSRYNYTCSHNLLIKQCGARLYRISLHTSYHQIYECVWHYCFINHRTDFLNVQKDYIIHC